MSSLHQGAKLPPNSQSPSRPKTQKNYEPQTRARSCRNRPARRLPLRGIFCASLSYGFYAGALSIRAREFVVAITKKVTRAVAISSFGTLLYYAVTNLSALRLVLKQRSFPR
ncbi:MAG: hypothetical protein NTY03_09895 [Candidatus Bathyarchaeota archaeon]|nr:hypothetical protein [Candidatus Bathyarchaeota archaeon]